MAEHSGTHIDALCHQAYDGVHARRGRGRPRAVQTPTGFTALGIDTVAPIVRPRRAARRRAVLGGRRRPISTARDVELRPGDVVLVRLGSGALWADTDAYLAAGGMTADASRWLAERKPFAVGADNVAWDLPDGPTPSSGRSRATRS